MQAVESQNLILYHTDLRGQWPEEAARSFAVRLRYLKRLALGSGGDAARASLAGIALALRALGGLLGRRVEAHEIVFASGEKPRLAQSTRLAVVGGSAVTADPLTADPRTANPPPDFSISHSGPWVACAAIEGARLGLDIEVGTEARIAQWVVREALLKATGAGLREVRDIEVPESPMREGCLSWRGEHWYLQRLDFLPGTSACVLTSCPVHDVAARNVSLTELFAI